MEEVEYLKLNYDEQDIKQNKVYMLLYIVYTIVYARNPN